jgi:membrane-associated phospholipid phosphatase
MLRGIDAGLLDFGRAHAPRRLKALSTLIDRVQRADAQFLAMALVCLAIGRRDRHAGSLGWLTPLAVMAALIPVELLMKRVVLQPPPGLAAAAPMPGTPSWCLPPYAFPSGAMTRTTMLLGLPGMRWAFHTGKLRWLWPPALGIACAGLNVVFALSHWPTDALGGLVLGAAGLLLAAALSPDSVAAGPSLRPDRKKSANWDENRH